MPSANKTPNYNLTQYSDNGSDKISALKDYNEDMSKIDVALNDNANNITKKADAADMTAKLAAKADATETTAALATKANAAETIAALDKKADADDVYSKTDIDKQHKEVSLNTYRHGNGLHAVFIGDSITQGYQASDTAHRWTTLLSKKFGWIEHNYAVGGSGFTTVGQSSNGRFDSQCATASADSTYDHSKVVAVCIVGGVNDGAPSDSTAGNSTVLSCINALKTAFPNAQIYAGIGISGSLNPNKHGLGQTPLLQRLPYYTELERVLGNQDVVCISSMWEWIYYEENWQNDDTVHPNDAGYARIATLMSQIINGTYGKTRINASFVKYYDNNFGPNVTRHSLTYNVIDNILHIYGDVGVTVPAGDPAIGKRIFTTDILYFPAWFRVQYSAYSLVVNNVLGDIQGPTTYQTVAGIAKQYNMASLSIATYLPPATAPFKEKDTMTLFFDSTYPAVGLGS